ncbi:unnamed protein product [Adineta steineri]|uniref:GIY-YIG domain-containing protein n=1 Tax=Adineta steineri TaxID=433720 RepID=A0A819MIY1_9BILA|nr:unnamed protein product [Adineta steineri]
MTGTIQNIVRIVVAMHVAVVHVAVDDDSINYVDYDDLNSYIKDKSIIVSFDNTNRPFLLPIFPSTSKTTESNLLLANIPGHHLNPDQFDNRCRYAYHQPTSTRYTTDHQRRLSFLSRLWNINYDILECNFMLLIKLANLLGANRVHRFSISENDAYLNEDEYSIAMEFFLQIDINLFYMKTCSYREAIPISNEISLICMNEPQVCYSMTQCNRTSCSLCYPSYKLTYRNDKPIIQFGPNQQHQFINNYRSILNCPATCNTQNIIYVLTCPCQQVDYIGATSLSLAGRLSYHQKHSNRIVQEFLLGEKNITRIHHEIKSNEDLSKDSMALYQHTAHCPAAIQWFLDENPEYWIFVPIETNNDECRSTIDSNMFSYAQDISSPPINYQFTNQQKIEIDRFFHEEKYLKSPINDRLDLYQAAIVAILPTNGSNALRQFIEALFITHTEAQLNTDGHLDKLLFSDGIINNQNDFSKENIWCKDLVRRPF